MLFFVILISFPVFAGTSAYWTRAYCIYNAGSGSYACDSGSVSGNYASCSAANGVQCAEEGTIYCYSQSYCEAGITNRGPTTAYNVNWDSDSADCECKVGTGRWNLGGDYINTYCCGDDSNEFYKSQMGQIACCNSNTDCVDSTDSCVDSGTFRCYQKDYFRCDSGSWTDVGCCTDADCSSGYTCSTSSHSCQALPRITINSLHDPIGYGRDQFISADITNADSATLTLTVPGKSPANYPMANTAGNTWGYTYNSNISGTHNYMVTATNAYGTCPGHPQCISYSAPSYDVWVNVSIQIKTIKDEYYPSEIVELTDPPGMMNSLFSQLKSIYNGR